MKKVLQGRSASLSLAYGPISFDGILDDETPILITYLHEEIVPAVEIKVSADGVSIPSSLWQEGEQMIWRKTLPHAEGHDMSYIYPPSEIIRMIESETGLNIDLDPNTPLEIPMPSFMENMRHGGFRYALNMRKSQKTIKLKRLTKDLVYNPTNRN